MLLASAALTLGEAEAALLRALRAAAAGLGASESNEVGRARELLFCERQSFKPDVAGSSVDAHSRTANTSSIGSELCAGGGSKVTKVELLAAMKRAQA